jgi:hypothetical protein
LVPAAANDAASNALSVISTGNGQLNLALAGHFNGQPTAQPVRGGQSRWSPTPAVLKRSTSGKGRIGILSAGIRSPVQKAKGADPVTERDHAGTAGEIILEHRTRSNRNA